MGKYSMWVGGKGDGSVSRKLVAWVVGWNGQMAGTRSCSESLEGRGFPCLPRSHTLSYSSLFYFPNHFFHYRPS